VPEKGCAPIFWLFPTTGTCSGHAFWTCVCFQTSRTSRTHFGLSRFGLWCCQTGSARSGLRSHGYPVIAQTRSMELRRSSAASPYMLTIASSCSADSGLTQPPAAAYASCLTHAVCRSMYLNTPALASCSSVRPLGHWDRLLHSQHDTNRSSHPFSLRRSFIAWCLVFARALLFNTPPPYVP
jgi:hypothetical protein